MGALRSPQGGRALRRGTRTEAGFATRLIRSAAIVGLTEEDRERVRATRPDIEAHTATIVRQVYRRLLAEPETAAHFQRPGGGPDAGHVAERESTLGEWLRQAARAELDEELAAYLAGVARAHTRRGGDPQARVKGRYLLSMMSLLQSEITLALAAGRRDAAALAADAGAWNRLLMVHLDLLLAVYGGVEGNPHWY